MITLPAYDNDDPPRRLRFAPPNPKQKRLVLQEADFCMFEAIDRHGPLPTPYLYEFARTFRPSYLKTQKRLTELYNGDQVGSYLTRPPRQFEAFEARYQHIVYDLTDRAKLALEDRLGRFSPRRTDPFLHQLMGACVASSIELACREKGLRYIPREEILTHPKVGQAKDATNPMALPVGSSKLVPDDLFGIEYPGEGFRFFAVEIDRNTESIERRNLEQTAFGRKVGNYLEVLGARTFQAWWGIPNLSILIVTTNATHGRNILDYIRKQRNEKYEGRFALSVVPSFGVNWRVPKTVLTHLLAEPWATVTGTKDIGRP